MGRLLMLLILSGLFVGCASGPSQREKNDFFILRQDVLDTENDVYGDRVASTPGLYGHLKACSVNLHQQINPSEAFKWSEKIERFTDAYHSEDNLDDINRDDFRIALERYNHFKVSLDSKKDSYSERIRSCKSSLASTIKRQNEMDIRDRMMKEAEEQAEREPASDPSE